MGAHALNGQVGLAGIGGPKNGPDKAVTRGGHANNLGTDALQRKTGGHVYSNLTSFNHDSGFRAAESVRF
jgi:hypothetical protein